MKFICLVFVLIHFSSILSFEMFDEFKLASMYFAENILKNFVIDNNEFEGHNQILAGE